MFETPKVKSYLADVRPAVDGENRILTAQFSIFPLSHDLAGEIDREIADTLFKKSGTERIPRPTLKSSTFISPSDAFSLEVWRDPESLNRFLIPSLQIKSLRAAKLFPDNPNFSLVFKVQFESNDEVLVDLANLMKENVYLTFGELQKSLFKEDPHASSLCRLCEAPNPEFYVSKSKPKMYYCEKHVDSRDMENEPNVEKIRDLAAAAKIAAEVSS